MSEVTRYTRQKLHIETITGPLRRVLDDWQQRYDLLPSEVDLLARAATDDVFAGSHVTELARARGVEVGTVKKQLQLMIAKTGDKRLAYAVLRIMREAYALAKAEPRPRAPFSPVKGIFTGPDIED